MDRALNGFLRVLWSFILVLLYNVRLGFRSRLVI